MDHPHPRRGLICPQHHRRRARNLIFVVFGCAPISARGRNGGRVSASAVDRPSRAHATCSVRREAARLRGPDPARAISSFNSGRESASAMTCLRTLIFLSSCKIQPPGGPGAVRRAEATHPTITVQTRIPACADWE
jgi:hypothetical protein